MPTYDYCCDACGHKFELFQPITSEPEKRCPQCKKLKLRRLFGAGAAIMFKGSGFYKTDYRSEAYKKRAEADKPASSEPKSSESKSAEGKSADKGSATNGSASKGESKSKSAD